MPRSEPRWLGRLTVDEVHYQQIRAHGGSYGTRDEDALESALARPRQRWAYAQGVSLSELAAAYAFGLLKNRAYVDGNERTALVVLVACLDLNGIELTATDAEAVWAMLAVAGGEMTEPELAGWVEAHVSTR